MFSRKRNNILNAKAFSSAYPNMSYRAMLKVVKENPPVWTVDIERWAAMCVSVARGNTLEWDCDPIY